MKQPGLKLTAYFGEDARHGRRLLSDIIGDIYEQHGIQAAILLRAVEGFGVKHQFRTDRSTDIALNLPLVSIAVDTSEKIETVTPEVQQHISSGLLTVERATLLSDTLEQTRLPQLAHDEVKLTIYMGRRERAGRQLAFTRAVETLHQQGISGATVLLGLDGMTHGSRQRGRFLSTNANVPVLVISIGSRDRIKRALPLLTETLTNPPMTVERVRVCKRDGALLAEPRSLPTMTDEGFAQWHKLTVFAASGARHNNRPLGLELIRHLYKAGASGATLARGIWGFSGDHPPHGDRPLSIRRDTPIIATIICPPDQLPSTWSIIDELTVEHGLVSAETVPAMHAIAPNVPIGALQLHQFTNG